MSQIGKTVYHYRINLFRQSQKKNEVFVDTYKVVAENNKFVIIDDLKLSKLNLFGLSLDEDLKNMALKAGSPFNIGFSLYSYDKMSAEDIICQMQRESRNKFSENIFREGELDFIDGCLNNFFKNV